MNMTAVDCLEAADNKIQMSKNTDEDLILPPRKK